MSNSWRIRCETCNECSGYTQWGGALPLTAAIAHRETMYAVLTGELGAYIEALELSPPVFEGMDYISFATWHHDHSLHIHDEYGYEYNMRGERIER